MRFQLSPTGTEMVFVQLAEKLNKMDERVTSKLEQYLQTEAEWVRGEWQDDAAGSSRPGIAKNIQAIKIQDLSEDNTIAKGIGNATGGPGKLGLLHLGTAGTANGNGHRLHPRVHAANEAVRFVQAVEHAIRDVINEWA